MRTFHRGPTRADRSRILKLAKQQPIAPATEKRRSPMAQGHFTRQDITDARESLDRIFHALSGPLRLDALDDFHRVRIFIAATPTTTSRPDSVAASRIPNSQYVANPAAPKA